MSQLVQLKLSVSKTKTFLECQKKYHFAYILKFPQKDQQHHIFGKFAHKILENFHNALMNNCQELDHVIMTKAFRDGYAEFGSQLSYDETKEAKEFCTQYLHQWTQQKLNGTSPQVLANEYEFEHPISEALIIRGLIDKIQLDYDGIIHLIDYKTTKQLKYLKDDWLQLLTYAYVILLKNPNAEQIRCSYIPLRHLNEKVSKTFSRQEILTIPAQYLAYAKQINEEKEFAARPSGLCSFCPFLEHCMEGKKRANPLTVFGEVNW